MLGLSRIAVFKKVKKGQLPALRFGRNWAVPAAALPAENFAAREIPPRQPPAAPPAAAAPRPLPQAAKKRPAQPQPPSSDDEMNSMGWD